MDTADDFETALFETIYHTQKFCAAACEEPGWIADKRELVGRIDALLSDVRNGYPHVPEPDDYTTSQAFARDEKTAGSGGIIYPSVRSPGGTSFAAARPDVMVPPIQGRHLTYQPDGTAIDKVKDSGSAQVFANMHQTGRPFCLIRHSRGAASAPQPEQPDARRRAGLETSRVSPGLGSRFDPRSA